MLTSFRSMMLEMFNIHSWLSKMPVSNPSLSTPSLKDVRGTNSREEYQPFLLLAHDRVTECIQ